MKKDIFLHSIVCILRANLCSFIHCMCCLRNSNEHRSIAYFPFQHNALMLSMCAGPHIWNVSNLVNTQAVYCFCKVKKKVIKKSVSEHIKSSQSF